MKLPFGLRESPADVSGVADAPVSNVLSLLVRWPVCMQREKRFRREKRSRSFVLADGFDRKQVRACRWFCARRAEFAVVGINAARLLERSYRNPAAISI